MKSTKTLTSLNEDREFETPNDEYLYHSGQPFLFRRNEHGRLEVDCPIDDEEIEFR